MVAAGEVSLAGLAADEPGTRRSFLRWEAAGWLRARSVSQHCCTHIRNKKVVLGRSFPLLPTSGEQSSTKRVQGSLRRLLSSSGRLSESVMALARVALPQVLQGERNSLVVL